jgi:AAA domain
MSRYFLTELSIEGFRGINNSGAPLVLTFKPECVNSVHAQNGVGKTSIFEALQYALKGEIPRLKKLQDAEQGDAYIVNKFHPTQQASIDLKFTSDDGTGDVTVSVARNAVGDRTISSPSGHPDPEQFLSLLNEDFVLVDYHTFAGFIDTTALARGRSFSGLIGLSNYSFLRQALEGANHTQTFNSDFGTAVLINKIASERATAARAKASVVEAFRDLTTQEIGNLDDREGLEAQATGILAGIGSLQDVMAGKTVVDFDHSAAVAAIEAEENGAARRALAKLRQDRETINSLTLPDDVTGQLDELVAAALARDSAVEAIGSAGVLALLKSAAAVIGTPAWPDENGCPVCELPQPAPLKERLTQKIALYDAVADTEARLCKLCQECPAVNQLAKLESSPALGLPADQLVFGVVVREAQVGLVSSTTITNAIEQADKIIGLRDAKVAELEAEIAALESKLPPSLVAAARAVENAKKFRDEFANFAAASVNLATDSKKLAKIERWKTFIDKAAKAFADAESDLSSALLAGIKQSYQALFPLLMRGGHDVKPNLARAANSENVELRLSDFYGEQNVSARAVLSESYRNAVASSIFLSAATKHTRPPRFMILDDITSSFDGGHQFFLMDALRTKLRYGAIVDGIQFIILSHDAALEKYFDKLGSTPDWHHQKLQGLPPNGSVLTSAQGADRLKAQATSLLSIGNVELGGVLVRQYLEYKLGYIISKLRIPVPTDYATRPDNRTLSTYLDAITSAVTLYGKAGDCVLDAAQVAAVANTATASLMSNMVSHYETGIGQPLGAPAMLGVIAEIDAYADNFRRDDPQNPNQRIYYKRLDKI